jgi:hypothetical protein
VQSIISMFVSRDPLPRIPSAAGVVDICSRTYNCYIRLLTSHAKSKPGCQGANAPTRNCKCMYKNGCVLSCGKTGASLSE